MALCCPRSASPQARRVSEPHGHWALASGIGSSIPFRPQSVAPWRMDGHASPREPKIYECLLIIEFDEGEPGAPVLASPRRLTRIEPSQRAQIKYTYPESISDATIVRSAPVFCFPEENIMLSWEQKRCVCPMPCGAHCAGSPR